MYLGKVLYLRYLTLGALIKKDQICAPLLNLTLVRYLLYLTT